MYTSTIICLVNSLQDILAFEVFITIDLQSAHCLLNSNVACLALEETFLSVPYTAPKQKAQHVNRNSRGVDTMKWWSAG